MLSSPEHKISNADKYKNYPEIQHFSGTYKLRMLFFLLINVKMPTVIGILSFMSRKNIVGILTFMSRKSFMLS